MDKGDAIKDFIVYHYITLETILNIKRTSSHKDGHSIKKN